MYGVTLILNLWIPFTTFVKLLSCYGDKIAKYSSASHVHSSNCDTITTTNSNSSAATTSYATAT
jgi:hypothetical protein